VESERLLPGVDSFDRNIASHFALHKLREQWVARNLARVRYEIEDAKVGGVRDVQVELEFGSYPSILNRKTSGLRSAEEGIREIADGVFERLVADGYRVATAVARDFSRIKISW
jgi:hypothetical protein